MMTAPNLSQKQLNFARFSIVCVDIIKLPLKDILNVYIKPTELEKNIKSCPSLRTGESKLNPDQQRKCCFISCSFPDYSKFDVPLLYKLIRNLCPTLEPSNKWGNTPTVNDVCVGDDIERIRVLRNAYFAHTESAEVSDDEFKKLWHDVKCVVNRCQQFTTSKGCNTDYNQMLTDLERRTLTFKEYTSGKERSGAIYVLGDANVLCGETASLEAEITLEEDVYLPISWDRVEGLSRKQLDMKKDKYSGSNSRQLLIHRVCKDDEAGYQAVISKNQDVKIFSNEVYLRALGDPPCLEEMGVTSKNSEISIFYVVHLSEQSPMVKEIRWTKNTLILDLSKDKYRGGGLADNCIIITSPGEEDRGEYTCTVSNAVGSISKSVKLDIPRIEIPSKSKVPFGSETRLNCHVCGYPSPDKAEWQKSVDGTIFHAIDIDGYKHFGSSTGSQSPYLLVRNASLMDQQYYRVVVSNLIGKCISNTLFLQVTGNRPNMSEGTCTLLDRSVKLRCDVFLYDESPTVNDLYWTKNGIKLDVTKSNGKYSGVDINDPSLTINSINHNDAGDYQLIAVNAVGETGSEVIVLGVPDVHLEKQDIKEDGSMWFTMTIKSVPVPHLVQWNVKEEHSKTFQQINVNAAEYKGTSDSFPHPVLVLNHIKKIENYIFEIEVQNRIGEVKREIPGGIYQGNLKTYQRTVGKFYTDSGSRLPFAKLFNGLAEKFPTEKIPHLKHLIESSVILNNNTELQKATSAAECFTILRKEDIFTSSDVMAMQFLLRETNCKELEKECVEYAEKRKAMYFHEKSPENGYQNVRLHVVENVFYFNFEDENKIRETVANIVGCSIEDIRVNGYRLSNSFYLVLSIREIYISQLFTIQQHDKDKLLKLKIDCFEDDLDIVRVGYITDEHKTSTPPIRLSSPEEVKVNKYHLSERSEWLVHDTKGSTHSSGDALCWHRSSEHTNGYCAIQNNLKELYSSLQGFVVKEEFKTHIQRDAFNTDNIEEKLEQLKVDVMRTECPIVIAGETSSGKSSIINLILGERIIPTGIGASTSRMCRVKHSDCYKVSTKNRRGEIFGEKMLFKNSKEMAEKLQDLARRADEEIGYVDIYMPVSMLQGNVMIVDTPGFNDQEQQGVAEKMMSYLPNALAFIFVLNVSNAGGIQDDRILPVLSKIKNSMARMVSFSPEDVIFLLNKWDTISHEDDGTLEIYFKQAKQNLRKMWNDVDESHIFKISASKVSKNKPKYTRTFDRFRTTLKEVIAKNENKRVKVHLRYLNDFLEEFNRVLATKLKCANENAEESQHLFDDLSNELQKLEQTRKEEILNIERNIDTFLYKAASQFHEYIHSSTFREKVLKDKNKATRISIGKLLDTCFENETKAWQEMHIEEIFQKEIMADLMEKFEKIHRTLHLIKDNLKGFKTPFDVDNKIGKALSLSSIRSGAGVVFSFVLYRIAMTPAILIPVATVGIVTGLVMVGLQALEVLDDFDTVCSNAFMARVKVFTVDEIKRNLRKAYFERIKEIIEAFLDGDLKREIERINANISRMRDEKDFFKLEEETLSSLQSTVIQKIERLQQIERIDITTE